MKRKLDAQDLVTFFAYVDHCDKRIMLEEWMLRELTEITCPKCDEPLAFRGSNGLWYFAGERIFP